MWRFPLAGLLTVGGLILLFGASLSDPRMALRALRAVSPVTDAPGRQQAMAPANTTELPVAAMPSPPRSAAAPQVAKANAGTIPAEQTEPAQGAAAGIAGMVTAAASIRPSATVVSIPVNREPVSYAPPWQPDTTPISRVHFIRPSTGPPQFVAAFRRDLRALFRALR